MTIKSLVLLFICTLGLSSFLSAQSSVHLYGTCEHNENVYAIDADSAGNQYVVNDFYVSNTIALSKLSPTYDLLWTRTLKLDSTWQSFKVSSVLCYDSTVFIGGSYFHFNASSGEYGWRTYIACFNINGVLVWIKNLDIYCEFEAEILMERVGNNIIYTANVGSQVSPYLDKPTMTCITTNGNVLWSKRIMNVRNILDIQVAPDSSLVFLGQFEYFVNQNNRNFLLKLAPNGDELWQTSISSISLGSDEDFGGLSIDILSDTSILVCGTIVNYQSNSTNGFYGKFNLNNGNCIFSKNVDVLDHYISFDKVVSEDGTIFLIGIVKVDTIAINVADMVLTKINNIGTIEWIYTYGESNKIHDVFDAVYSQSSIITVGRMFNYGSPYVSAHDIYHSVIRSTGEATNKLDTLQPIVSDFPLVPYDSLEFSVGFSTDSSMVVEVDTMDFNIDYLNCTLSTVILEEISAPKPITLYPNPADNQLTIESTEENLVFSIMDMTGRVVLTKQENVIDVSGLEPGYYIIRCDLGQLKFYKL